MDLYSNDHKLSEFGENDFMGEVLDQDVFSPTGTVLSMSSMEDNYGMDEDWLDSFFEDPVLNDRMISEAMQPPHIKSEHSYSLNKDKNGMDTTNTNTVSLIKVDKDMDTDYLNTVNPSLLKVKEEPLDSHETQTIITTTTNSTALTQASIAPNPNSLIKTPTIIVATQQSLQSPVVKHERIVMPKVSIKVEPSSSPISNCSDQMMYDCIDLPPTPPSSTNSDSEGSQSPSRSAPSSPVRPQSALRHNDTLRAIQQQPLFSSPIPTSGVLVLSEEEKRTLISEGYPIPNKLPLTKQEEKNLKKIRRKIKNKISAQESRRKKKEYLESLEKRVETFSQENNELRKKCDSLENNNRSLLSQLQKLQASVGKAYSTSTTGGTCLMVLVLCFAVFFGQFSPMSFSMGSVGLTHPVPTPAVHGPVRMPMGPEIKDAVVESYATPNMKSRVLLSTEEDIEMDTYFGPHTPFSYRDMFNKLFNTAHEKPEEAVKIIEPSMPDVSVKAASKETIKQVVANVATVDVVAVDARQINATA